MNSRRSRRGGIHGPFGPSARNEILFVTDRRFWRRSIGSEQRIATLILHLARRGEHVTVAYVGRANGRERARLTRFLASAPNLDGVVRRADWMLPWKRVRSRIRGAWKRGSRRPSATTDANDDNDDNHDDDARGLLARDSPTRRAFVQSVIEKRQPRIVIVEFLRLTYSVYPRGAGTRACQYWIDTHDILHERAESYRAAGASVARATGAGEEIRALETYDTILAIQKPEGERLRRLAAATPVIVVPHGVAPPALPERMDDPLRPTRLGFLGGRDESNRHALDWFVDSIWPTIRSRLGEGVEFHVAGQVCHGWHRSDDGIVLVGPVKSIDLFWPDIDIAINPIRFGSGLKIKNVEALAYGRPLITTSIGAEGLEAASPDGLRIADTAIEWGRALDEWLSQPSMATTVGRAGRAYAMAHLSEEAAFHDLTSLISATFSEAQA